MKKSTKLKPAAILFDMDGVLVDSLDSWWKSLNTALKNYKNEEISREEFIEKFWGHELLDNLEKLGLDGKIGAFCNNIYYSYIDELKIFSGTKKILKKLDKYPKAIITNTPRDCAVQILKKFGIDKHFKMVITSDQVQNGKPAPDIVFEACKRLDVKPEEVILIGDTESDVKAGRAAGCIVIGINIDADFSINSISELPNIINS
jgi:HAD superfamily hydrolase (TIGR01509 family)